MPEPEANPAQSEQQAGPADSPAAWFYLEPETSQSVGPFDAYGLAGAVQRTGAFFTTWQGPGMCRCVPEVEAGFIIPLTEGSDSLCCAGLLDSGAITVRTLVWAEGQESWAQLQQCAQLYAQVYYISSVGASTPRASQKGECSNRGGSLLVWLKSVQVHERRSCFPLQERFKLPQAWQQRRRQQRARQYSRGG